MKRRRWLWVGILLTLVVGGLCVKEMRQAFRRESEERDMVNTYGTDTTAGGLDIWVTLVDVDPIRMEALARVVFHPSGTLSDDQDDPIKPLKVYCNTLSGEQDHFYRAGESMSPFEMKVNLTDGLAADYPFDHFVAELEFQASIAQAHSHATDTSRLIPISVHEVTDVSGIRVSATDSDSTLPGYVRAHFAITRSDTVIGTAIFGMVMMWAIGISVLSLTLNIVITHEHLNTLTFLSGLLFALFSFRNSLPGTPPVGTLSDFVSFFWVEAIISLSLVVVVILNVSQRGQRTAAPIDPAAPASPDPPPTMEPVA